MPYLVFNKNALCNNFGKRKISKNFVRSIKALVSRLAAGQRFALTCAEQLVTAGGRRLDFVDDDGKRIQRRINKRRKTLHRAQKIVKNLQMLNL